MLEPLLNAAKPPHHCMGATLSTKHSPVRVAVNAPSEAACGSMPAVAMAVHLSIHQAAAMLPVSAAWLQQHREGKS